MMIKPGQTSTDEEDLPGQHQKGRDEPSKVMNRPPWCFLCTLPLQLPGWWEQTQGDLLCLGLTEWCHRRLRSRSRVAPGWTGLSVADVSGLDAGCQLLGLLRQPLCIAPPPPPTHTMRCAAVSSAARHNPAAQSDKISAGINCYLSQLLVTLSLRGWCAGVWQESSRSIHLPLILLSPSVSECWQTYSHMHAHTHTLDAAPRCAETPSALPAGFRLNGMIITLQLAHVTEPCLSLPCPSPVLKRWHLLTEALVDFMLMPIVGGCLCVALCFVRPSAVRVRMQYVNSRHICSSQLNHSRSPISFVSGWKFNGLNCILSSAESGDTYQRQVLSIFSIASGICLLGVACMALYRRNKWVMPASATLADRAPWLCRKSTLLSWHGAQWNSKCESARRMFQQGIASELCRMHLGPILMEDLFGKWF